MTTDFFWLTTFGLSDDEYDNIPQNKILENGKIELVPRLVCYWNHTLKRYCPVLDVYNVITDYCLQYYMREMNYSKNITWTLHSKILTKGDSFRKQKYILFYIIKQNPKEKPLFFFRKQNSKEIHVFLTVDETGGGYEWSGPALSRIRLESSTPVSTKLLRSNYCLEFSKNPRKALQGEWVYTVRNAVHQQVSTLHLMYCLNLKDCLYYFQ